MGDDAGSENSIGASRTQDDNVGFCTVMNAFENMFACGSPATYGRSHLRNIDECDYDKSPTRMYKAIEKLAWTSVLDFMVEGTWQDSGFEMLFPETDIDPPAKQAGMWVTKFSKDGNVEWSRIPLHAAMIHGAPYSIVKRLVNLFPEGIRCTDDKGMLPLHLAIKHSSTAKVLRLLLEKFPAAMFAKDNKGIRPMEMREDERSKILRLVIDFTTKKIQEECGQIEQKRVQVLQHDVAKLSQENEILETKLMSKTQLVDHSTKEKEQLLRQLTIYEQRSPQSSYSLPSSSAAGGYDFFNMLGGSGYGDRGQKTRSNRYQRQEGNGMSDSSARIQRLDLQLKAERERLDEKNRLNRELRREKEKLEEDLQRSKQQVRRLTKQSMQDDLKYCQQKINELNHHRTSVQHPAQHYNRRQEDEQRRDLTGLQERDDVEEDFQEEDDLERRIRQSQATVSRLLQRTRRGAQPRPSRDQSGTRRDISFDVSEMTTPSFGGRSTEDVRNGLHKMMKTNLKQKETGIRDQISRMRHYHV